MMKLVVAFIFVFVLVGHKVVAQDIVVDNLVVAGDVQNVTLFKFAGKFNPYTYAGGLVFDAALKKWGDDQQRKRWEKQMAFLKQMDAKLDMLEAQNDTIIQKIDALPAILIPAFHEIVNDAVERGRLDDLHIVPNRILTEIKVDSTYKWTVNEYGDFKNSFREICAREKRLSKLLRIPLYAELMANISGGSDDQLLDEFLELAIANLKEIEALYTEQALKEIASQIRDDYHISFKNSVDEYHFSCKELHIRAKPATSPKLDIHMSTDIVVVSISDHQLDVIWSDFLRNGRFKWREFEKVGFNAFRDFLQNAAFVGTPHLVNSCGKAIAMAGIANITTVFTRKYNNGLGPDPYKELRSRSIGVEQAQKLKSLIELRLLIEKVKSTDYGVVLADSEDRLKD